MSGRLTPAAVVLLSNGWMKAGEEFCVGSIDWGVANEFLERVRPILKEQGMQFSTRGRNIQTQLVAF
jgi:hypothetical protein